MREKRNVKKVLFCDDEFFIRALYRRYCKDLNLEFITLKSGLEVLSFLRKVPVDLVISDMNMPPMDGLELAQALGKLYPDLPILIVSSNPYDPRCQEAFDLVNVINTIFKPANKHEFKSIIEHALKEDL